MKKTIDSNVDKNLIKLAQMHPKDLMDFIRKGQKVEDSKTISKDAQALLDVGVTPEAVFNAIPEIFEARVKILSNAPEYTQQDPNVAKNVKGDMQDFFAEMIVAEQKINRKGSNAPDFFYKTTNKLSGDKIFMGFKEKYEACQSLCLQGSEAKDIEEFKKAAFNFADTTSKNPHTAKIYFDKVSKTQEEKEGGVKKADLLIMTYSTLSLDMVTVNPKLFKVFAPQSRDLTVGEKIKEFFSNFVESIMLGMGALKSDKKVENHKFDQSFKTLEEVSQNLVVNTDVTDLIEKGEKGKEVEQEIGGINK